MDGLQEGQMAGKDHVCVDLMRYYTKLAIFHEPKERQVDNDLFVIRRIN